MTDSIIAVIPAKDEEGCVGAVIAALGAAGIRRIRVVDNGSADRTAELARQAGAELLFEPIAGYGRACWTGLQNLPAGVEWILFCDADGSDDLAQLPAFLSAARHADFVLGRRLPMADGRTALTPVQKFGNRLATSLIRWGWGHRFYDLGPFRLVRRSALDAIQMQDRSWGWTIEMQVRAIEEKLRVVELPVASRPRVCGRSKISGTVRGSIRAGTVILATLGKLYFRRWARS